MVIGITTLSPISIVPIVVSVAGAIANGLCYYAFYADYPTTGTVVAVAFADITWLVQEAGLSFYSYLILTRVLQSRSRVIFMSLFWTIMIILLTIRTFILVNRAKDILEGSTSRQNTIDHLHIGYFSSIALVECISAFFLLRKFARARRTSIDAASTSGLFSYLMKSTEIRLATLALIGFSRAITYSFQTTAQSATTPASQLDRFVYTLECMFPVMMFIDTLASRVVASNYTHESSSQSRSRHPNVSSSRKNNNGLSNISMYPISHVETRIDSHGAMSSSQERIIEGIASQAGTHNSSEETREFDSKNGAITKTVEFDFHESAA